MIRTARTDPEGRRERGRRKKDGKSAGVLRPLGELRPWESCTVERVDGEWKLRRRLAELGFLPGTPIQVGRMAPMGDPIELRIRGYRITLSREQALRIWVLPQTEAGVRASEPADVRTSRDPAQARQSEGEKAGRADSAGGGQDRWYP